MHHFRTPKKFHLSIWESGLTVAYNRVTQLMRCVLVTIKSQVCLVSSQLSSLWGFGGPKFLLPCGSTSSVVLFCWQENSGSQYQLLNAHCLPGTHAIFLQGPFLTIWPSPGKYQKCDFQPSTHSSETIFCSAREKTNSIACWIISNTRHKPWPNIKYLSKLCFRGLWGHYSLRGTKYSSQA